MCTSFFDYDNRLFLKFVTGGCESPTKPWSVHLSVSGPRRREQGGRLLTFLDVWHGELYNCPRWNPSHSQWLLQGSYSRQWGACLREDVELKTAQLLTVLIIHFFPESLTFLFWCSKLNWNFFYCWILIEYIFKTSLKIKMRFKIIKSQVISFLKQRWYTLFFR